MKRFLIILLVVTALIIPCIVSAETLTGELGSTGINTTNYNRPDGGATSAIPYSFLRTSTMQYVVKPTALIRFTVSHSDGFDANAPASAQTTVTFRLSNSTFGIGGTILGTGSIGYQRIYDWLGAPLVGGYTYVIFNDDWTGNTLSGTQYIYLDYNHNAIYNDSGEDYNTYSAPPTGTFIWMRTDNLNELSGLYTMNRDQSFLAQYTATKPAGLGITGIVSKTIDGKHYSSQIFIANSTYNTLTSESTVSTADAYFNVYAEQIYICALSAQGNWANSSLLFGITPTPTPFPTPTITPYTTTPVTPTPGGYAHTVFDVISSDSGARLTGINIDLYDVKGAYWSNATADADGEYGIYTIPGDSINVYLHDPSGIYNDTSGTYLTGTTSDSVKYYTVTMYRKTAPVAGYGTVYVSVLDADNDYVPLTTGSVLLCTGGCQPAKHVNGAGVATFNVTQNTDITATASAPGYLSSAQSTNTGTFDVVELSISLHKATTTVTTSATTKPVPTKTPTPTGSWTPIPTTPPNYTGFWGPLVNALSEMGALPTEIGLLLAGLLVLIGFIIGGWSGRAYDPGAPFNGIGSIAGGILGFLFACAFGFIPLVYIIVLVFVAIFALIFFR